MEETTAGDHLLRGHLVVQDPGPGGLPFALVAGLLAKPKRMNTAAAFVTAVALLTGFVLLDGRLSILTLYPQMMFGPLATTW